MLIGSCLDFNITSDPFRNHSFGEWQLWLVWT